MALDESLFWSKFKTMYLYLFMKDMGYIATLERVICIGTMYGSKFIFVFCFLPFKHLEFTPKYRKIKKEVYIVIT